MNERQPQTQPIEGDQAERAPEKDEPKRFKTFPVRLEEGLHSQLRFLAQLSETSIVDEVRRAIEERVVAAQSDPEIIARADKAREEIEREAAARRDAISGFLGTSAVKRTTSTPAKSRRAGTADSK